MEALPTPSHFPSAFPSETDHTQGSRAAWPNQEFNHNLGVHTHRTVFPQISTSLSHLGFCLNAASSENPSLTYTGAASTPLPSSTLFITLTTLPDSIV